MVHANPNIHPINIEYNKLDDEDRLSEVHSTVSGNAVPLDNNDGAVHGRKEHPHLTGMLPINFTEHAFII